jgi:hypothetical protein
LAQAIRRGRKAEIERQEQEEWKKNRGYSDLVINKDNLTDQDREQRRKQRLIQLSLQNNLKYMQEIEQTESKETFQIKDVDVNVNLTNLIESTNDILED